MLTARRGISTLPPPFGSASLARRRRDFFCSLERSVCCAHCAKNLHIGERGNAPHCHGCSAGCATWPTNHFDLPPLLQSLLLWARSALCPLQMGGGALCSRRPGDDFLFDVTGLPLGDLGDKWCAVACSCVWHRVARSQSRRFSRSGRSRRPSPTCKGNCVVGERVTPSQKVETTWGCPFGQSAFSAPSALNEKPAAERSGFCANPQKNVCEVPAGGAGASPTRKGTSPVTRAEKACWPRGRPHRRASSRTPRAPGRARGIRPPPAGAQQLWMCGEVMRQLQ